MRRNLSTFSNYFPPRWKPSSYVRGTRRGAAASWACCRCIIIYSSEFRSHVFISYHGWIYRSLHSLYRIQSHESWVKTQYIFWLIISSSRHIVLIFAIFSIKLSRLSFRWNLKTLILQQIKEVNWVFFVWISPLQKISLLEVSSQNHIVYLDNLSFAVISFFVIFNKCIRRTGFVFSKWRFIYQHWT